MTWFAVAIGGAAGSLARHGVNIFFSKVLHENVPYATAAVNILGSLLVGALAGSIASGRLHLQPFARTLIFVGLLGGFTTFSSFMLDTVALVGSGRSRAALLNLTGQLLGGMLVAFAGYHLALRLR
jgi:fluoride exporter